MKNLMLKKESNLFKKVPNAELIVSSIISENVTQLWRACKRAKQYVTSEQLVTMIREYSLFLYTELIRIIQETSR